MGWCQRFEENSDPVGRQLHDTDTTLLRRLRDLGDEQSWADFYCLYAPFLERVLVRTDIGQADAMDAIQETMAVVSKRGITVPNVYVRKGHVKQKLVNVLKEIDD